MPATLLPTPIPTRSLRLSVLAILIVLPVLAMAGPYPKINLAAGYEVDPNWPKKPVDIKWDQIAGVTVDKTGRVWIFNRAEPPVQVYSPEGDFLFSWGEGLFKGPHYLRIDHEGNVWTADFRRHLVRKFTQDGKLLLTLGTPDEAGDDETHLSGPTDMVVSPEGDIFVSDGYGNNRVVHYDKNGRYIKEFGGLGVDVGQLSQPHSIAMDSKGILYVCERNNGRIQQFTQDGKSIGHWRNLINPWGIHITSSDDIFVCGSTPARWTERGNLGNPPHDQILMRFDTTGRALELWGFPLAKDGELEAGHLDWIHGMGFDDQGNLYASDVDETSPEHRVQKFVRLPAER
jgi:hypothetical protein